MKKKRRSKRGSPDYTEPWEDERFAFIAGYTENGVPYGTTWEEINIEKKFLTPDQISPIQEIEYIVQRAKARDSRIIGFGLLLFFSTDTGDAWVLDLEDQFALCLAREGNAIAVKVLESSVTFAIQWEVTFRMEGDVFTLIHKVAESLPLPAILSQTSSGSSLN